MYCKPEAAIYYQLFFMNLNCCLQLKPKLFLIILSNPVIFIPVFRAPELVRDRREPRPGGCVHQEGEGARHTGPPHHRHQHHQPPSQLRPLDVQVSAEIFLLLSKYFLLLSKYLLLLSLFLSKYFLLFSKYFLRCSKYFSAQTDRAHE